MQNSLRLTSAPGARPRRYGTLPRAARLLLAGGVAALAVACSDATPTAVPHGTGPSAVRDMAGGGGRPVHFMEGNWPMDFPAGSVCSFELVATPGQNNSLVAQYPPDSNGDVVQRITGLFVQTLTNAGTGKSMTLNLSGPLTFTFHADGSTTVVLDGPTEAWFYATDTPASRFIIIYGHAQVSFTPSGQETLDTISGSQLDVCAALS